MANLSFAERRRLYGEVVIRFLRDCHELTLLVDMPGNVGDHLIWAGTRRLLESYWLDYEEVSVDRAASGSFDGGTLLVPGSGAWVKEWHEWLPDLVRSAAGRFERVVILPSQFDPRVPVVAEALDLPNVYAFAREPASYRAIKRFGRAVLAFDPALYGWEFDLDGGVGVPGDAAPILVSMRTDAGSRLPQHGLGVDLDRNDDVSVTAKDLEGFLQSVRSARAVVTDRLHVAVAGIMLARPVDYFDPYDRKISTYLDFTFRTELPKGVVRRDADWLVSGGFACPRDVG